MAEALPGHRFRAVLRPVGLPAADLALAAVFLAALLTERFMLDPVPARYAAAATAAGTAMAVALALRRRLPFGAFLLSGAALCAEALTTPASWLSPYANLLGTFSVALYATARRARWALVVLAGCTAVYFAARDDVVRLTQPTGVLLVWLALWSAGYAMARRREEQRTARELIQERAMTDERARIARELHDLIGHTVNLMLVQAGAGRRVLDHDPERAKGLLSELERAGREALTELDRVLGLLRDEDGAGAWSTEAYGLELLPGLAERMAQAGLRVTVRNEVPPGGLPHSLDLTAYRIVQEGLTNVLKHADARTARVSLRLDDGWLGITVEDNGRGPAGSYRPGRGLLGIRERAALFGGTVTHGPGRDPAGTGGFTMRCRLRATPVPVPARPSESSR
ncbi:two-component sensor histidine kinase [Actinoplanes sp. NBRC 14428]|uniref:histidine kinase n=1 Tax=Pseudosporangium ferrugineum TaxID=439699 RepID=A0A2T0RP45_9ACTN|nr:sensor histidine kinase [Pseudosporangium ferrugineum]PRY22907.1 signal transduction histidine kinase [Pseudosporangium ferrugineum]BCJ55056.1 two-component sensor histidine kinase [Actinoplanes sp. NBRC 14428]